LAELDVNAVTTTGTAAARKHHKHVQRPTAFVRGPAGSMPR
jgi:hypothetical protein